MPLDPDEDDLKHKSIKARGMSARVLLKNAPAILSHWERYGTSERLVVGKHEEDSETGLQVWRGLQRFVGMKSGVPKHKKDGPAVRDADYGEWVPHPVQLSLDAAPKRVRVLEGNRLEPWDRTPGKSFPYKKANKSPEALEMQLHDELQDEQADGDFELH